MRMAVYKDEWYATFAHPAGPSETYNVLDVPESIASAYMESERAFKKAQNNLAKWAEEARNERS